MRVLFLEDIKKVGKRGQVKNVADGFARNFLIPKKIAEVYTEEREAELLRNSTRESNNSVRAKGRLVEISKRVRGVSITLRPKKNESGVLFAALHKRDILRALEGWGIHLPQETEIEGLPIKHTGRYTLDIKFLKDLTEKITLTVT